MSTHLLFGFRDHFVTDGVSSAGLGPSVGAAVTPFQQRTDTIGDWNFIANGSGLYGLNVTDGRLVLIEPSGQSSRGLDSTFRPTGTAEIGAGHVFGGFFYTLYLWHEDTGLALISDTVQTEFTKDFVTFNDRVWFEGAERSTTATSANYVLWSTDGTTAGTRQIFDARPDGPTTANIDLDPRWVLPDRMVFTANYQPSARDYTYVGVYATDGSTAGTSRLPIADGARSVTDLVRLGNDLYFTEYMDWIDYQDRVWITDGTAGGSRLAVDEAELLALTPDAGNPNTNGGFVEILEPVVIGGRVYVIATFGGDPAFFDITGGTARYIGRDTANNLRTAASSVDIPFSRALGTFFIEGDSSTGAEAIQPAVFAVDPTTGRVTELITPPILMRLNGVYDLGDRAVMLFRNNNGFTELVATDGTAAGTILLTPGWSQSEDAGRAQITLAGDKLYFIQNYRVWVTDGTVDGTRILYEPDPREPGGILGPVELSDAAYAALLGDDPGDPGDPPGEVIDRSTSRRDLVVATGDGDDRVTTGSGNDRISTGDGSDVLNGGAGNDLLDGGGGADTMFGGAGNDTYVVDNPGDTVSEARSATNSRDAGGTDTVRSAVSFDLAASVGLRLVENLVLTGVEDLSGSGNTLSNRITGNGGDNALVGLGGDDSLSGGEGDDVLDGGSGRDRHNGGNGYDTATYAGARAAVTVDLVNGERNRGDARGDTFTGIERITGSSYGDRLTGSRASDTLDGGAGNDRIDGGRGADRILGGAGTDTLVGGSGDDTFVFLTASDSLPGSGDTLADFARGSDLIDLDALGSLVFVGDENFTGVGQVRAVAGPGGVIVTANLAGDSTPDFTIFVARVTALDADDFVI